MTANNASEAPACVQDALLRDHSPHFFKMLRYFTLDRFKNIAGLSDLVLEEEPNVDAFVYASRQTMIVVSGSDLRITYRAHFNVSEVKPLFIPITGNDEITTKAESLVVDIFREYTNLTAGAIKQEVEKIGMKTGISLPILTSGYDEIISSDRLKPRRLYDYFRITGSGLAFTGTTWFDVVFSDQLDGYVFNEPAPASASDDDIDFF